MIDPTHTGGAKIPTTRQEAIELAAEIRMRAIWRRLAGAGFSALEKNEMKKYEEVKSVFNALKMVEDLAATLTGTEQEAMQIVLRMAEDQIRSEYAGGWE